jgi:mannosyltransferase OCH1-like enzyme
MKYYYLLISVLVIIICINAYQKTELSYETMQSNLEITKLNTKYTSSNITPIIPLDIYQTWHTKKLPKYMKKCTESLQRDNPEFKYHLYDDADCREFIKDNFDNDVLYAYDTLIPGAYKADLWRYCILYKKGGIYLDIKYKCMNGFKLITLTDNEYFVKDRYIGLGKHGIYNAFMICKSGNKQMIQCINQIVKNVKIRDYCTNPLEVSGPLLLIKYLTPGEIKNIRIKLDADEINQKFYLLLDNNPIITMYPEYRMEQKQTQKTKYYDTLWREKNIYNN